MMTSSVYAQSQISISTDKQTYAAGDVITISGTISSPGSSNSAVLQIYNPFNILVQIGTIKISSDATYSKSITADGPSWNTDGSYTIKILYVSPPSNAVNVIHIDFKARVPHGTETNLQENSSKSTTTQTKSSKDNYNQSQNAEQQIKDRIELAKKIQESLGTQQASESSDIPLWIKQSAKNWHDGKLDNSEFSKDIKYMISKGFVKTKIEVNPDDSFRYIPSWMKVTSDWWYQGLISDDDYVTSIEYLIDEKIIK